MLGGLGQQRVGHGLGPQFLSSARHPGQGWAPPARPAGSELLVPRPARDSSPAA